jgi:pimeloyl-ACP methyl ester carboxylesterase
MSQAAWGHRGRQREFAVSVPGGVIAASQTGSAAPPVLILHGGPGLSDYTASLADELQDAFSVIRFQQRGLRPSTTSGPFDVDRHVTLQAIFVLGAASPPRHRVASAALIPGAQHMIEANCGHFPWLERPGSVRHALQHIGS